MPTYLCHGFRWVRRDIRIFVILHDLEDAAPDWLIGRVTSKLVLDQFCQNFDFLPKLAPHPPHPPPPPPKPKTKPALHHDDDFTLPPLRTRASDDNVLANQTSPVKLLEEYDLAETENPSRPYAYVADYVTRVELSANIADEMAKYDKARTQEDGSWFEMLRDKLQAGADMRWYVVVCADEDRAVPEVSGEDDSSDEGPPTPVQEQRPQNNTGAQPRQRDSSDYSAHSESEPTSAQGSQKRSLRSKPSLALRRLFGRKDNDTK